MRGDIPNKILGEKTIAFNDIHNLIYNEFGKLDENRVRPDIGPKIKASALHGRRHSAVKDGREPSFR